MEENGQPLVSIVLPTYNGIKYIKQSIDSCFKQTYKNLELIVVDDGSFDDIFKIVNAYSDNRIRYLRNETNLGLATALNRGFAVSSGEYLTWQSDDNFYAPDAIASMAGALKIDEKVYFVYANFYKIDEKGKVFSKKKVSLPKILDRYNCIGPCFLYRRAVYEKLGGYNPDFYLAEDYEYWLRIKKSFLMKRMNKFLCYYRYHEDSLTSQHKSAEVEEQTKKASNKYISFPSIKHYHEGKLLFYKKEYIASEKALLKSFLSDPFNSDTIKMLLLVFVAIFSPFIANKIKKTRY